MSLITIRPWIRDRMNALGFQEWTDGFNTANIPSTILDKAYHILSPAASGVSQNHADLRLDYSQSITFFRKGFNNPAEAIDSAIADVQAIILDLMSISRRSSPSDGRLNVILEGFTIEPLNDDNDNSVKATLNLSVQVVLGTI